MELRVITAAFTLLFWLSACGVGNSSAPDKALELEWEIYQETLRRQREQERIQEEHYRRQMEIQRLREEERRRQEQQLRYEEQQRQYEEQVRLQNQLSASEQCDPAVPHLPHETDCSFFYHCDQGQGGSPAVKVLKKCGPGTLFNSQSMICDWPQNVYLVRPECEGQSQASRESESSSSSARGGYQQQSERVIRKRGTWLTSSHATVKGLYFF